MEETKNTVENAKVEETGVVGTQPIEKNEEKAEVKTFTQEELDEKIKERLDREKKKMPSKEDLDKFNSWKESQKTDADKQAEKERELETLKQENLNSKRENALLKKGINVDDIDYVLFKVGKMDGEFDENLEKFIKENPKYTSKEEKSVGNTTGTKTNGNEQKSDGVLDILKAKHPNLF